ncbi:hypothetical protein GLOTRDRAFT_126161 [Gloeophyllum trabeum ATCC 11539]|uniref:Uncharacterized protein n=1 Tax=Gloeophyllum trabeum (strain ATCC 11539 / FP-39264 / Madison 617) TaxID=670483 RepID=S7S267_GLOTA|nr:uncharacterized protein GLOTRDRAFT_126161 [Gloeophyllum trabeum ATCC 11539]EPQ59869.1 hypothetical protein GLOTRDRAFT_126161 [Gloeophyllum trabeum ATCC 11539]
MLSSLCSGGLSGSLGKITDGRTPLCEDGTDRRPPSGVSALGGLLSLSTHPTISGPRARRWDGLTAGEHGMVLGVTGWRKCRCLREIKSAVGDVETVGHPASGVGGMGGGDEQGKIELPRAGRVWKGRLSSIREVGSTTYQNIPEPSGTFCDIIGGAQ